MSPAMARRQIDTALGPVLRRYREQAGLSQEKTAHAADLTVASYAAIERGKVAPGWWTVRQIAVALDVPLGELAAAVEAES